MPVESNEKDAFARAAIQDSYSLSKRAPSTSLRRYALAILLGALLGALLSVVVDSVLFEISVDRLLGFYFGIVFVVVGGAILVRSYAQDSRGKRIAVAGFAIVVISAGALSLTFRTEWLWKSKGEKIVIYSVLGVATSFLCTFVYVDLLSVCHDQYEQRQRRNEAGRSFAVFAKGFGLIESGAQVQLVLIVSAVTGFMFGLIFGLIQIEEHASAPGSHHVSAKQRLVASLGLIQLFSLPFGCLIGATGALANECIRAKNLRRISNMNNSFDYTNDDKREYKVLTQDEMDGV